MGALGTYLREAREARGIDLRDAAQQTRISLNYLKALEDEDFARLPGEVFVKGFLKNYGKFLQLDEAETMKRFGALKPPQAVPAAAVEREPVAPPVADQKSAQGTPLEPFIIGIGILVVLVAFLFMALPEPRRHVAPPQVAATAPTTTVNQEPVGAPVIKRDKLYLEVIALDNTWLLVRTDNSPQKKVLLKKGESLIWTADERFVLSYGSAGALKLQLDGKELIVNEPKNAVVRDLAIAASGIVSRKSQQESPKLRAKRQPVSQPSLTTNTAPSSTPAAVTQEQKSAVSEYAPASPPVPVTAPAPAPVPAPVPAQ